MNPNPTDFERAVRERESDDELSALRVENETLKADLARVSAELDLRLPPGMGPPIETIRKALQHIHHVAIGESDRAYMSIPADPKRDADLILVAAIDELDALRADLARVSGELGLPPSVGPAHGELARLVQSEARHRAAYESAQSALEDALVGRPLRDSLGRHDSYTLTVEKLREVKAELATEKAANSLEFDALQASLAAEIERHMTTVGELEVHREAARVALEEGVKAERALIEERIRLFGLVFKVLENGTFEGWRAELARRFEEKQLR